MFILLGISQILYGYVYSDDLYFFHNKELLNHPYNFFITLIKTWGAQGRITPLMFGIIITTTKFLSVFQYKIYLFLLNTIALLSFKSLVEKLVPNFDFLLWCIFFFSLFQFHVGYHCAFNSFNGMYPLLVIFISFSAINSLNFLETNFLRYKGYAIFFYLLALLIIEISYITPLILLSIIYFKTKCIKRTFLLNKEIILLTILFISTSFFLKYQMHFQMNYIGLQANLECKPIIKTYVIQAISSLPLIYLFKQKDILLNLFQVVKSHWAYLLAIISISILVIKQAFKSSAVDYTKSSRLLIIFGTILWLFPPLLIAISAKYQNELYVGRGYIPMYIQNFGVATICYVILNSIKSIFMKKTIIICSFLVIFITLFYNFYLVEEATKKSYQLQKELNP
jgi:hypothetical protein